MGCAQSQSRVATHPLAKIRTHVSIRLLVHIGFDLSGGFQCLDFAGGFGGIALGLGIAATLGVDRADCGEYRDNRRKPEFQARRDAEKESDHSGPSGGVARAAFIFASPHQPSAMA